MELWISFSLALSVIAFIVEISIKLEAKFFTVTA